MIAADNAKYHAPNYVQPTLSTDLTAVVAAAPTFPTEPTAMMVGTAEDMENNTPEASGSGSATFSIARACAVSVDFPAHTMNGEVQIADLGDVAGVMGAMPEPW